MGNAAEDKGNGFHAEILRMQNDALGEVLMSEHLDKIKTCSECYWGEQGGDTMFSGGVDCHRDTRTCYKNSTDWCRHYEGHKRKQVPAVSPEEHLIDTVKAAKIMGLPEKTLRSWRYKKIGPEYIKISAQRVRYRLSYIRAYIKNREVETGNG